MLKCLQTQVDARGMVCTGAAKEDGPARMVTGFLCWDCGLTAKLWVLRLSQADTRPSHDRGSRAICGIGAVGQTPKSRRPSQRRVCDAAEYCRVSACDTAWPG
jgi:hypothetical protein